MIGFQLLRLSPLVVVNLRFHNCTSSDITGRPAFWVSTWTHSEALEVLQSPYGAICILQGQIIDGQATEAFADLSYLNHSSLSSLM